VPAGVTHRAAIAAPGSFSTVPIRLVATTFAACAANKRAYTTLRYVFPNGTPWPLPPANHTVGLTCG